MNVGTLGAQQLDLTVSARPSVGAAAFPPFAQTVAGSDASQLASVSAAFLRATVPTNQPPVVASNVSQAPVHQPGVPQVLGQNEFAAQYAPQIYALVLNGLELQATVAPANLPGPPVGGTLRLSPGDQAAAAASLSTLAGSSSIFSPGPAPQPAPAPAPQPAPPPQPAATAQPAKAA